MLFSSPGAELPDVYLSESVIFLNEAARGCRKHSTTQHIMWQLRSTNTRFRCLHADLAACFSISSTLSMFAH